jgi:predicted HTH transcriptional regulator
MRFEEQTVGRATLDDLSEPLWSRFLSAGQVGAERREDLLHQLGLAREEEDGVWRPTVAGVLLACAEPRRFLPNAFIQAVAYSWD